jgi:tRNA pseudouridine13 synthase
MTVGSLAPSAPIWRPVATLPWAHGGPTGRGRLRERADDFVVDEILGFAPDGEGEHQLLRVRKTGANTEWVARQIAAFAGLPQQAVSWAGLKDRHAVTTQWFCVHTGVHGGPDWSALVADAFTVLESHHHRRKLRPGALEGNRFRIRVRGFVGDRVELVRHLDQVSRRGVPNYFGEQRFGRGEGNLYRAQGLFTGEIRRPPRHQRGLWLSAARSQLFNQVLALRVERADWDCPLPGDCMQLAGSGSFFPAETLDQALIARTASGDIHPSGPLWGRGVSAAGGEAGEVEASALSGFESWTQGLAAAGLDQERRALRLPVADWAWGWVGEDGLELSFKLPAGAYATSVLRELIAWDQAGGED